MTIKAAPTKTSPKKINSHMNEMVAQPIDTNAKSSHRRGDRHGSREIRARHADGGSYRAPALEYELTEVMIYTICTEGEAPPSRQMNLIGG
jgi:hypothetical protein